MKKMKHNPDIYLLYEYMEKLPYKVSGLNIRYMPKLKLPQP